jgi:tRNA (guanine26-N2/guanine27-N2)-dimethyltransferase
MDDFTHVHLSRKVNNLSLMHGHLFQSTQCPSFHVTPIGTNELVSNQLDPDKHPNPNNKKLSNVYKNGRGPCDRGEPVCGETGATYKIGGPLWIGPLHDLDVVNYAIDRLEAAQANKGVGPNGALPIYPLHTATTLHGLLVSVSEELPDVPLYYTLTNLCSAVNSMTIPMQPFRAALVNAGYRVSAYHKEPQAVKTDAPNCVVWDIVRAWCKAHPPSKRKESLRHKKGDEPGSNAPPKTNQPPVETAEKILSKEITTKVDFTIPNGLGEKKKARRFAVNPEANWGPKKAASGKNKRKLEEVVNGE